MRLLATSRTLLASLPTRGGWIEMHIGRCTQDCGVGPSPHGEGGLKLHPEIVGLCVKVGPSPHGEGGLKYIRQTCWPPPLSRPSPHGEGGLKYTRRTSPRSRWCPSPHGEGGLKSEGGAQRHEQSDRSLPTRGGWIEIRYLFKNGYGGIQCPSPHGEGGLK